MEAFQRTQIYLKKDQMVRLKIFAREQKRTLSELIRQTIDQFFPASKKEKTIKWSLDHVSQLIGQGESPVKNLSQKVDDYLYGNSSKK